MLILAAFVTFQSFIEAPDAVRRQMDTVCKGWQLAAVIPEVAAEIQQRTPTWPPNLIPGDFNGDRKVDVAMLVDCKGRVQLQVFLAEGSGFSRQALDKPEPHDARQFLHLIRKEYEFDAIGVEFEAIGGRAWIWRDGRWVSVAR
jgi:hypothetical protein